MTDIAAGETPVSGELTPTVETGAAPDANTNPGPFAILIGTIIRPAATFAKLREARNGYWWFVLLVTVLMIAAVSAASAGTNSARAVQFTGGGQGNFAAQGNFPANGGTGQRNGGTGQRNGTTGQRTQGGTGGTGATGATGTPGATGARQFAAASPLLLIGLPVAAGVVVTLLDYVLRALIVFLGSMVLGGKAAFREVFRMASWTTLPAAVRNVVHALAVVLTGGQVAAGFSAALSAAEVRSLPIWNLVLGYVDVYTLWSALLLGIGAVITGKLSKGKAAFTVAIYLGVSLVGILVFYAVSSAIGGALGGGAGSRGGLGVPGGGGVRIGRPGG